MTTVRVYAEVVTHGDGYAWHFYSPVNQGATVRSALASQATFVDDMGQSPRVQFYEGQLEGNGNVVTDWCNANGAFAALARSILTFDTSVLDGFEWDSVSLNLMHSSEAFQGGPTHIVKATVADPMHRAHSDFDYTAFGTGALVTAADSAGSITPILSTMVSSGALTESRLVIDPTGYTTIGLVSEAEITNSYVTGFNVHHYYGSEQASAARHPYLEFLGVTSVLTATSVDDHVLAEWGSVTPGATAQYLERRVV